MDGQIARETSAKHRRSGGPAATRTAEIIGGTIALSVLAIAAVACSSPPPATRSAPAATSPAPAPSSAALTVSNLRHLPSQLLGLSENTSPNGRAFTQGVASSLSSNGATAFTSGTQTALYGSNGPTFLVWASSWTSAGASNTVAMGYAQAAKLMSSSVSKDAQSFPAGPHGGGLFCGHVNLRGGGTAIECWWVDQRTTGIVVNYAGFASSPDDAASKTTQIRAVIEPLRVVTCLEAASDRLREVPLHADASEAVEGVAEEFAELAPD
jgi:hypothetical protein